MDPRVNTKVIGTGIIAVLAIIASILFVIHRNRYEQCSEVFRIHFDRSVTGLRKGDPVVYNGINAGRVKDMKPDFNNLQRVIVTVCLERGFPIKTDAIASLESKSITGGFVINIHPGSNDADEVKRVGKEIPVLANKDSNIDQLMQSLPKIMASVEKTVDSISKTFSKETTADLQKTIKKMGEIMERMEIILTKNEQGIDIWLTESSVKLSELMGQALMTFQNVDNSLQAINKSPRRFLYKDASQGITPDAN